MKFRKFQRRTLRGLRWFWHLRIRRGGEIVFQGDSSGYHNEADADRAIEIAKETGPMTLVEVLPRPMRLPRLKGLPS